MHKPFFVVALLALATSSPVFADANGDLEQLVSQYWADNLKESPVFASSLGVDTYANEVGDYSLAGIDRRAATAAWWAVQPRMTAVIRCCCHCAG